MTVSIEDSLFNGITKLGNYTIYASLEGGTYHIEFLDKTYYYKSSLAITNERYWAF
jgi:hypothetical protein